MATAMTKRTTTWAILFLLSLHAAAALTITSVDSPGTIQEGNVLHLGFETDVPASYRILRNGTELATTNTYDVLLGYDTAGVHIYTLEATTNVTVKQNVTVTVINIPLLIVLQQPADSDYAGQVPVVVETSTPVSSCIASVGALTVPLSANSTLYSGTLALSDGIHTVDVLCSRAGENATASRTITVDNTAPTMTVTPQGILTDYPVPLRAVTGEVASCTYRPTGGAEKETEPFPTADGLTHQAPLYLGEGLYSYRVVCQDVVGNAANATAAFTLKRPPTGKVTVDSDNPHRAGDYEVELEVSELLQNPPTLTLRFGESTRDIPLQEDGSKRYKGVIIVQEGDGEQAGSFAYRGVDLDGTIGTALEEAPLFIVDTVKPSKVEVLKAANGSSSVNLTWFYSGKDGVRFNIYRTETLGVAYTDLLTTAVGNEYRDYDVEQAVTYHYRVAAVDDAGNVGELSPEVFASPATRRYDEEGGKILDPLLQIALDRRLREVEVWILDAERAVEGLQQESGRAQSETLISLGILGKAQEALRTLERVKEQLERLSSVRLEAEEFSTRVSALYDEAAAARASMPVKLELMGEAEYEEAPAQQHVGRVARVLSSDSAFEKAIYDMMAQIRIIVTARQVRVTTADGGGQEYTIITKILSGGAGEASAIEVLPDGIDAKGLLYLNQRPLLEEDGMLQYSLSSAAEATISYAIPSTVETPLLRTGGLIVAPKPGRQIEAVLEDRATGSAIVAGIKGFTGGQGILVILGCIVIAGLLFYYFKMEEAPPVPAQQLTMAPALPPSPETRVRSILVERKEEPLAGLLLRANLLIDAGRYTDALYFYRKAVERFETEPYSSERLVQVVKEEIGGLYHKLALFHEMGQAHDAIYAENVSALDGAMARMREHASLVDSASGVVQRAKDNYRYFYARLNALQAERNKVDQE